MNIARFIEKIRIAAIANGVDPDDGESDVQVVIAIDIEGEHGHGDVVYRTVYEPNLRIEMHTHFLGGLPKLEISI